MGGTRCGEKETGRAGLSRPGSFCTPLFQLKMLLPLAHFISPFKVHFNFTLFLKAFLDPLPDHW